jgi:hypothetical protein
MRKSLSLVFAFLTLNTWTLMAQVDFVIPKPQESELQDGQFRLQDGKKELIELEKKLLQFLMDSSQTIDFPDWFRITWLSELPEAQVNQAQGYRLLIDQSQIKMEALTATGVFNAWQSLKHFGQEDETGTLQFQAVHIRDWPAFKIRGFMHDVGRSFIPVDELMEQIRILSAYKINVFHWHLTEDLAWRLESEIFPELTAAENMERFPGLFYTKSDVRKLLEVAKLHQVTVIPEIDMPGHSAAFKRALGFDMQSPQGISALKMILEEARELFQDSPYIHLGTDEVKFTDPKFVPEIVAFARGLGFKVISWNPGWDYQQGEIDMLHLWSYRGKRNGTIPVIDSRFHYINHFDPFADLISLFRSNVLGQPQGDEVVAGSILATWNDRKLADSESILLENNFYPLMLTFAERLWQGGGEGYFDEVGVLFPESGPGREAWEKFEDRLLHHQSSYFSNHPFPYVKQSEYAWKIIGPFDNEGDLDRIFPVEKALLSKDTASLESFPQFEARGGTIYLRHVWGPLVPAYVKDPKPNSTAYAITRIYSPIDQEVSAWISFQDYSRSEKDLPPPAGDWDWKGSKIWVNSQAISPPEWQNRHVEKSNETALANENFQSRPPTSISLKKGWNQVILKLPVGQFSTPELRLVKWMFSFALCNEKGLSYSIEPMKDTEKRF